LYQETYIPVKHNRGTRYGNPSRDREGAVCDTRVESSRRTAPSEAAKKLQEEKSRPSQRRKGAKFAKQAKEFVFAVLCVLATLRETLSFFHSFSRSRLGTERASYTRRLLSPASSLAAFSWYSAQPPVTRAAVACLRQAHAGGKLRIGIGNPASHHGHQRINAADFILGHG
jgi:hypothetical protein